MFERSEHVRLRSVLGPWEHADDVDDVALAVAQRRQFIGVHHHDVTVPGKPSLFDRRIRAGWCCTVVRSERLKHQRPAGSFRASIRRDIELRQTITFRAANLSHGD